MKDTTEIANSFFGHSGRPGERGGSSPGAGGPAPKLTPYGKYRTPHMPLYGHPYHAKTEEELRYIMKDAGEARDLAHGMGNAENENKYADQVLDAGSVLYYRRQHNLPGPEDKPNEVDKAKMDRQWKARLGMHTLHAITLHDQRESKKQGYNPHGLAIAVGAHQEMMKKIEGGTPTTQAMKEHFNDRLHDRILKGARKALAIHRERNPGWEGGKDLDEMANCGPKCSKTMANAFFGQKEEKPKPGENDRKPMPPGGPFRKGRTFADPAEAHKFLSEPPSGPKDLDRSDAHRAVVAGSAAWKEGANGDEKTTALIDKSAEAHGKSAEAFERPSRENHADAAKSHREAAEQYRRHGGDEDAEKHERIAQHHEEIVDKHGGDLDYGSMKRAAFIEGNRAHVSNSPEDHKRAFDLHQKAADEAARRGDAKGVMDHQKEMNFHGAKSGAQLQPDPNPNANPENRGSDDFNPEDVKPDNEGLEENDRAEHPGGGAPAGEEDEDHPEPDDDDQDEGLSDEDEDNEGENDQDGEPEDDETKGQKPDLVKRFFE